ncbi:MAG: zinc-dependent alcohol dehydrogenase family protein, partial [Methyloprofundus sp.]|nr:zinc-dependent alcohol dehydrogenase family protein [Methyloprofundus sp.]
MKAIVMTAAGDSSVLALQELAEPKVTKATEVKIKIQAAGVNPIDTKVRSMAMFYPDNLPAVLGCDLAGEIIETGADVTDFKVGDKVWACHGGLGAEQGNYAEFTVIESQYLSAMPNRLDFNTAAAAPLVLITAWGALFDRGRLQAKETVLIHAGAGGVGHVAIQLAKAKGARVITTVSSTEKAAWVKSLGADEVILYTEENLQERVDQLTQGEGVDLTLDTVGGDVFSQSITLTAHFGRIVTLLAVDGVDLSEARIRNLSISFELMLVPMLRQLDKARQQHIKILEQCAQYIDNNQLTIKVAKVFPLAEAKTAHELIEAGHTTG